MRSVLLIVASLPLASVMVVMGQSLTINFDKDEAGRPPTGWTATQTGTGAAKWTVIKDNLTFKDAGKVLLWTKADSVTLFDDFSYGAFK